MTHHRDGNMIVDGNGVVVCLMCESDSFGELHTAHNADANAEVILKAFNDAAEPVQYQIGPNTMERVFKAAGLTDLSDLQAVMDAVEKALTVSREPTTIKGENFVDFLKTDRPYICRKTEGTCYLLVDRETGEFVGYRKYDDDMPTVKPLEWKRGEYVSSAVWARGEFMVQPVKGDGFKLFQFFTDENEELKITDHPTREAAEAAAQILHNEAVAKYLSD